jgi:hypothetical protein
MTAQFQQLRLLFLRELSQTVASCLQGLAVTGLRATQLLVMILRSPDPSATPTPTLLNRCQADNFLRLQATMRRILRIPGQYRSDWILLGLQEMTRSAESYFYALAGLAIPAASGHSDAQLEEFTSGLHTLKMLKRVSRQLHATNTNLVMIQVALHVVIWQFDMHFLRPSPDHVVYWKCGRHKCDVLLALQELLLPYLTSQPGYCRRCSLMAPAWNDLYRLFTLGLGAWPSIRIDVVTGCTCMEGSPNAGLTDFPVVYA